MKTIKLKLGAMCSFCNQMKEQRVWKFKDTFIKVGPTGIRWDGDVCPDCKIGNKRDAIVTKPKRTVKQIRELLGPDTPLYPPKVRYCRECGVGMTNRYFTCVPCTDRDYGFMNEVDCGY